MAQHKRIISTGDWQDIIKKWGSNAAFAAALNIDRATVGRYVSGKRVPSPEWIIVHLLPALEANKGKTLAKEISKRLSK